MTNRPRVHALALLAFTSLSVALTGCMLHSDEIATPTPGTALAGHIMGGQQPVSGSAVTVYQLLTTGYGQAMQGLASTLTDSHGAYSFPANSYTCPTSTTPIVIMAEGGNPLGTGPSSNSAISLAAFAGPCGNLSASTVIQINEVTTVAAAYVLHPFASLASRNVVSTSSTNTIGLTLAYNTYANLVNNATGTSPGTNLPSGLVVPATTINSLANTLAACVNTTSGSSLTCQQLFSTTGTSLTGPTANTFNAVLGIADSYPTYYGSTSFLYNLAGSTPPFQPALTSSPADWTLYVTHTGGQLNNAANAISIDRNGDVVVATSNNVVSEITNAGRGITNAQLTKLSSVADNVSDIQFDLNGDIAMTSKASGDSSVYLVYPTGIVAYSLVSPDTGSPESVQIDSAGNALVVADSLNASATNSSFSGSSVSTQYPGFTPYSAARSPVFVASGTHQPYFVSAGNTTLVKAYSTLAGSPTATTLVMASTCKFTFDPANLWCLTPSESNAYFTPVATLSSPTSLALPVGASGGEIDGSGNLWIANVSIDANHHFLTYRIQAPASASASTLPFGYPPPEASFFTNGLQIDPSGNVWVARGTAGGLIEIIGAAAPTRTPLSDILTTHSPGVRP